MKKFILSILAANILINTAAISTTSCSVKSETETYSNSDPYEKYSKKLGTKFNGNEDLNLLKEISEWLGTPYKYAQSVKGKGTDCSGFVSGVYSAVYGISLQRSSYLMINDVEKVSQKDLQFGDILFFSNNGKIYHVGIYLGNNNFVHSATSKNIGVIVNSLTEAYYKQHFYVGGRVKALKTKGKQTIVDNSTSKNTKKTTSNTSTNTEDKSGSESSTTTSNSETESKYNSTTYKEFSEVLNTNFTGKENLNLLKEIESWLGTPHKAGAISKGVGTDAAGLISGIFQNYANVKLSNSPAKLIKEVTKISKNDMAFGDIVFFENNGKIIYSALYLGDGKIIHCPATRQVVVTNLSSIQFKFNSAGRVKGVKTQN